VAKIRSDWYRQPTPRDAPAAPVSSTTTTTTTRVARQATVKRSWLPGVAAGTPTWQTMGAMVAGSVLALALVGSLFFGAVAAPDQGVVAGEQARRSAPVGAAAGTTSGGSTVGGVTADAARPGAVATGDPAIDRALQQAQREGRLTPEQVAALSRSIAGEPTFEDVRRLTDEDIRRLADATGLSTEQLAPVLARLVATGRIVLPVAPPQAVAGVTARRPIAAPAATRVTTISRDTLQSGGGTVSRETISSAVVTATPEPEPEVVAGEQARAPLPTAVPRWIQNGAPVVDPRVRGPIK
jgi:hypothetical protein